MTQIKSDDKEFLCSHEEASNETNSKTQKKDTIKPEVHNDEKVDGDKAMHILRSCLLYTSPSPRDRTRSRMPSSA